MIFYICKVVRLYFTSGFQTPEQSTCALIFETIESREGTISILKDKRLYLYRLYIVEEHAESHFLE